MAISAARVIRWRVAVVLTGIIMVVVWRLTIGAPRTFVQIEFGMAPEELVGALVVIDGEERGRLERRGARTVNGFEVEEGDHTVEVRQEGFLSEMRSVTTRVGAPPVRLMVDFEDRRTGDSIRTVLVLH